MQKIESLPDNNNGFIFTPVSLIKDVRKAILSVRQDGSTGHDSISAKYLKIGVEYIVIVSPICHIINESIRLNLFSEQWKISRISPIPEVTKPIEPNDF